MQKIEYQGLDLSQLIIYIILTLMLYKNGQFTLTLINNVIFLKNT